jgi:hypothetical protein
VQLLESIGCGFSLGGSEAAKGYEHGSFYCSCIVKEITHYLLEVHDLGCSETWGLVRWRSELNLAHKCGECGGVVDVAWLKRSSALATYLGMLVSTVRLI